MNAYTDADRIIDDALRVYQPSAVVVLFSGGYDSLCTALVTSRRLAAAPHTFLFRLAAVDTGISADGWRDFVIDHGSRFGQIDVWSNPDPGWYWRDSLQNGTPYTRYAHNMQFARNKQRAIRIALKSYKRHRLDRVLWVTGIRRAESRERRNAPEHERRKDGYWCNPVVNWSADDVMRCRVDHDLPVNPFYDTIGGSGDCVCNWGGFTSLDQLRKYSPKLYARIKPLDAECRARHGYGWGEKPSAGLLSERAGQVTLPGIDPLTPNLCAGCERPSPTNDHQDFVTLQRMDWSR